MQHPVKGAVSCSAIFKQDDIGDNSYLGKGITLLSVLYSLCVIKNQMSSSGVDRDFHTKKLMSILCWIQWLPSILVSSFIFLSVGLQC